LGYKNSSVTRDALITEMRRYPRLFKHVNNNAIDIGINSSGLQDATRRANAISALESVGLTVLNEQDEYGRPCLHVTR
jgi:hypothetical protein